MPLMSAAIINSLPIALMFALGGILFPQTLFGLLTNHREVHQGITNYTIWLLPLLSFTAIAFMLEAYFIGLKAGAILRNASLIAFFLVFLPVISLAWYLNNVELLWLSLTLYMLSLVLYLSWQMLKMQHNLTDKISTPLETV
jgi:MATE family multidrug resistance protein